MESDFRSIRNKTFSFSDRYKFTNSDTFIHIHKDTHFYVQIQLHTLLKWQIVWVVLLCKNGEPEAVFELEEYHTP